jgi:phage terminase small subunit
MTEVTDTPTPPPPPDHLSDRMAAYWCEVVDALHLEVHEVELLRRLCEASDTADTARRQLDIDGLTTTDRFGQVRTHPLVAVERDARTAVARLTRELRFGDATDDDPRPPRLVRR